MQRLWLRTSELGSASVGRVASQHDFDRVADVEEEKSLIGKQRVLSIALPARLALVEEVPSAAALVTPEVSAAATARPLLAVSNSFSEDEAVSTAMDTTTPDVMGTSARSPFVPPSASTQSSDAAVVKVLRDHVLQCCPAFLGWSVCVPAVASCRRWVCPQHLERGLVAGVVV